MEACCTLFLINKRAVWLPWNCYGSDSKGVFLFLPESNDVKPSITLRANRILNTSGGLTPNIFHFRNNMPSFSSLAGCITFLHSCWSPFRQINNSIGNYYQSFLLLHYLLNLVRRMLQMAIMDVLNNFETRMHIVQSPVIICKNGVRICVEQPFAWETNSTLSVIK